MELIDLQCSLKTKNTKVVIVKFYEQYVLADQFPRLLHHAQMIIALFGSTYLCEQLFSKVIFAKSKTCSKLTDSHLEGTLRLGSTDLQPDIQGLMKQAQHLITH